MAKSRVDNDFYLRMQGMIYAHNIAKEEGIEALNKEIKKRGVTKIPLGVSKKDVDRMYDYLSKHVYTNMLTVTAVTLHECFGFGKKRLMDFKRSFDEKTKVTLDLDYMGEHYVDLVDYAVDMNEKFNLGLDIDMIAYDQDAYDKHDNQKFRKVDSKRVVEVLQEAGFEDAASFLAKKIG